MIKYCLPRLYNLYGIGRIHVIIKQSYFLKSKWNWKLINQKSEHNSLESATFLHIPSLASYQALISNTFFISNTFRSVFAHLNQSNDCLFVISSKVWTFSNLTITQNKKINKIKKKHQKNNYKFFTTRIFHKNKIYF